MPTITPLSVLLVVQAVLLAVSKLDFVTPTANNVIAVALIVLNAVLAYVFVAPAAASLKAQLLGK